MKIFEPILEEVSEKNTYFSKPRDFKDYINLHGLRADTWSNISVDSYKRLAKELADAGFMVFRLGKSTAGRSTNFSIVKWSKGPEEYFLFDESIFRNISPIGYVPEVPYSDLHCFSLIPNFTESSAVNLGLASGLFRSALGLDSNQSIPATGQSAYSFEFYPNSSFPELALNHNRGQVEIDAVFSAKRKGTNCVFVIEAKCSKVFDSLAKHKLAYSYWSIRSALPEYLPVVLVYTRVIKSNESVKYYIAECEFDGVYLNSLKQKKAMCYELPKGLGF